MGYNSIHTAASPHRDLGGIGLILSKFILTFHEVEKNCPDNTALHQTDVEHFMIKTSLQFI